MSVSEAVATEDTGDRWEAVRDLPPSAKLVAKVLDYNETLTQSQLAEETLLPPRTVRYALSRLEEEDVVESRFSFSDARKRLYTLSI
ncbi:MarR family transcriptional regulator [Natronocalculus amylovorans]|uniref:Winged helix-turn-helix domain-containing protein n=1 Tax=Natronocalculus amylovorans TaxID=2917812 RepID=A0AAE3K6N6_9EURY|nr:helix-turn-helix domain-containing protein [Natronocalculus amylovorans]MCL9815412.1 winged helix-turn-helix domain-containing protein [Natronocalculus amylovorans]NUE02073.1 MarR family transcriptional regulator [Halorubraceae archaeon YAN]